MWRSRAVSTRSTPRQPPSGFTYTHTDPPPAPSMQPAGHPTGFFLWTDRLYAWALYHAEVGADAKKGRITGHDEWVITEALATALIAVPVVNQIRTYWWCSPPRTGRQSMRPARSTARETGASFSKDRCVRTSL